MGRIIYAIGSSYTRKERAMEKKEISFGAYTIALLLFFAIPIMILWKVMLPVLAHDTPHFYHRGAECHEHQYFFWTGLFVLVVVFGLLIAELFRSYRIKPDPEFWQRFRKAFVFEFSIFESPFTIPAFAFAVLMFIAIGMVYSIGKPSLLSIKLGFGALIGLLFFLWLYGTPKKNGAKIFWCIMLIISGGIMIYGNGAFDWFPFLLGLTGLMGFLASWWDGWLKKRRVRNKTPSV